MVPDVGGCSCNWLQHDHHGKFPSTRYLQRVKITVAVPGIECLNWDRDQEVTLSGMACPLAFCRMADAINVVQRVAHVLGESGFLKHPLAVGPRDLGQHSKKEDEQYFPIHHCS